MLRFSITLPPERVEAAFDVLLPLVPAGVYERSTGDCLRELVWYGRADESPRKDVITARLGTGEFTLFCEEVADDPAERRRAFRRAWLVGQRLVLRAPGDPPGPPGLPEILIERQGTDFGTGAHPTTRAALEMLLGLPLGGSFADLGCGTGVLAIAAARLGFAPVTAVDVRRSSVEATEVNAERNHVQVGVALADLLRCPPPKARTVAANVPLPVHIRISGRLAEDTAAVIVSGVNAEEAEAARGAYESAGLHEAGRIDEAGWSTMLMRR